MLRLGTTKWGWVPRSGTGLRRGTDTLNQCMKNRKQDVCAILNAF